MFVVEHAPGQGKPERPLALAVHVAETHYPLLHHIDIGVDLAGLGEHVGRGEFTELAETDKPVEKGVGGLECTFGAEKCLESIHLICWKCFVCPCKYTHLFPQKPKYPAKKSALTPLSPPGAACRRW